MISGSIKPLQIKLLLSRMIVNNLTKLTNFDEKNQCKRLCFISVRVRAVLNYFLKKKSALREICEEKKNIL